jgi:hypothetical protein
VPGVRTLSRAFVALVTLAGCERVFELSEVKISVDADTLPDAGPDCFEDEFAGSSIDGEKWTTFTPAGMTNAVMNGRLVMTLVANASGHNFARIRSGVRELAGRTTEVELVTTPALRGAEAALRWHHSDGNNYTIWVNGPTIEFGGQFRGDLNIEVIDYSPIAHQFVRIEHDVESREIRFATRAANDTWRVRRTMPVTHDVLAMSIELLGGTYQPVADPGVARFDNLRSCPL